MEISQMKAVKVEAKTLKIHCKVSDCFAASLHDQDGWEIYDHDGYVPDFMPGDHYGDYIILDVDIDSGQIVNWKKPTAEQIEAWIAPESGD